MGGRRSSLRKVKAVEDNDERSDKGGIFVVTGGRVREVDEASEALSDGSDGGDGGDGGNRRRKQLLAGEEQDEAVGIPWLESFGSVSGCVCSDDDAPKMIWRGSTAASTSASANGEAVVGVPYDEFYSKDFSRMSCDGPNDLSTATTVTTATTTTQPLNDDDYNVDADDECFFPLERSVRILTPSLDSRRHCHAGAAAGTFGQDEDEEGVELEYLPPEVQGLHSVNGDDDGGGSLSKEEEMVVVNGPEGEQGDADDDEEEDEATAAAKDHANMVCAALRESAMAAASESPAAAASTTSVVIDDDGGPREVEVATADATAEPLASRRLPTIDESAVLEDEAVPMISLLSFGSSNANEDLRPLALSACTLAAATSSGAMEEYHERRPARDYGVLYEV